MPSGVKLFHQILKLLHRIFHGVGAFRSEIPGFPIAPVIEFRFLPFFLIGNIFLLFRKNPLIKIIHRHQKELVDAQLLQIGDLFCQSHKGALVPHSGILILRKASHMKMIKDPLLIGNFRMAVIFPVIDLKSKATPKGRNASFRIPLPEILPAQDPLRSGVHKDFLTNPVGILIPFRAKTFEKNGTEIPHDLFPHGNHCLRLFFPFLEKQEAPLSQLLEVPG